MGYPLMEGYCYSPVYSPFCAADWCPGIGVRHMLCNVNPWITSLRANGIQIVSKSFYWSFSGNLYKITICIYNFIPSNGVAIFIPLNLWIPYCGNKIYSLNCFVDSIKYTLVLMSTKADIIFIIHVKWRNESNIVFIECFKGFGHIIKGSR